MRRRSPTEIIIRNLTRRRISGISSVKRIIKKVLSSEDRLGFGLNIVFVTDRGIRRLNKRYRGRDSATDVLAFSALEGAPIEGSGGFLGDIAISLDAAERQAKTFKTTKDLELKLYVIHGVLHLLGYDDETRRDALKMKRRQEELMTGTGSFSS